MSEFSEAIITRVVVRGFRSLENVTVDLDKVTVLVGPNSSGKSSFVDALAFLQQSLTSSPQEAFKSRGGAEQVLTRTGHHPAAISIEVHIKSRAEGMYSGSYYVRFKLSGKTFSISEETCEMALGSEHTVYRFTVRNGKWVESVAGTKPKLAQNRLALPLLSGTEYFAPMYNTLTLMCFYTITPDSVSALHEPDEGDRLAFDGSNAASVLKRLRAQDETLYLTVVQAVSQVVTSVQAIVPKTRGRRLTLSFEESFAGKQPVSFDALSMSEGTLRVLAILLAVYQAEPPTLVGLEEPETAVHPGAAAVLAEALQEAALRTQILVTTHSPDLITRFDVNTLRAVERMNGITSIAPIVESQREAIRRRLLTAGEIHRSEGLRPVLSSSEELANDA